MQIGKSSSSERVGDMSLWSAGDKDEEGEVVIMKEERYRFKNAALYGFSDAFIETINNNQASRGWCIEISCLERLTKRLDNQRSELGFEGSSEEERVLLNSSGNLLARPGDVYGDLVGNCSDEALGVTACEIGTREEEAGEEKLF